MHILHLEDNESDAGFLRLELETAEIPCHIAVVQTRQAFVNAIDQMKFDLIVSDFSIPMFDGKAALEIARTRCPETPFIFVSGTLGEVAAIEGLVHGAADFISKERLTRLIPAVRRALQESEGRKARQRTEAALQNSKNEYQSLFENNLMAVAIVTPAGNIVTCNHAYARMLGFSSPEEAAATNMNALFSDPGNWSQFVGVVRTQKQIENADVRMVTMKDSSLHLIANIVGKFDDNGHLLQLSFFLLDITDRWLLEQHLFQAQKLESLGTLAGGIAHDFNNILGIIIGHAASMRRADIDSEALAEGMSAVTTAAERGASLVRQLLTFANKSEVNMERISLNATAREIAALLAETFPKIIEVSLNLREDIHSIIADSTQLHQVLLNICVNARDAMPEGGVLRISTKLVPGKVLRSKFQNAAAEEYVAIVVADTGKGMSEETRRRIFEPFFTAKEPNNGSGLGLSAAFGIVEQYHGFIDVASEPGKGSSFSICFPANAGEIEPHEFAALTAAEPAAGTETILFVEDEEMLRELAKMALLGRGYNVITAADGEEAIRIFKVHHQEIALVLSDLGLPKLDGERVFTEFVRIDPGVKFILASGSLDPERRAQLLRSGAREYIQKPYIPNEMLNKVRAVLDAP